MLPWTRILCCLALLLVNSVPALGATHVLDAMTDALPANPCLGSGRLVIFDGPFCDGAPCPPGTIVEPSACPGVLTGEALQAQLPGVRPGFVRRATVYLPQTDPLQGIWARVDPGSAAFEFTKDALGPAGVSLDYSWDESQGSMLDLAAMGASSLQFDLGGDVSAQAPLLVYVAIWSIPDGSYHQVPVTGPGTVVLPLADFTRGPGFDPSRVYDVEISVFECDNSYNCPGPYPARTVSVGPITFNGDGPTPVRPASWGRIKTMYR